MQKKSQIQMLETIAVLFIFFVLIMVGFVFYANIREENLATQTEKTRQLLAIEVAERASNLPELQCSEENIVDPNCIDLIKLEVATDIMKENVVHYHDRLMFSRITVSSIYPLPQEWTLYDRPNENYENKIDTFIPISLLDPISNKNSFGVMRVELFLK